MGEFLHVAHHSLFPLLHDMEYKIEEFAGTELSMSKYQDVTERCDARGRVLDTIRRRRKARALTRDTQRSQEVSACRLCPSKQLTTLVGERQTMVTETSHSFHRFRKQNL
jgi:hypothetical protein